jgi:transcriptional regulator with XRE-family HTH domain
MSHQALAARVREVREKHGYTQEQFADVLNISRQAYLRIEQGKRSISFIEIQRLANFLGVHYSVFTEFEDTKDMSLTALCRDEHCSPSARLAFEKVERILNIFSAQERLYYQMKEVENSGRSFQLD